MIKTHSLASGEAIHFGPRHAAHYLVAEGDIVDFEDWCGLRRRGNGNSYPCYAHILGTGRIVNRGKNQAVVLEVARFAPDYADHASKFWWEGTDEGREENRQRNVVRLMHLSCGSGGRDRWLD